MRPHNQKSKKPQTNKQLFTLYTVVNNQYSSLNPKPQTPTKSTVHTWHDTTHLNSKHSSPIKASKPQFINTEIQSTQSSKNVEGRGQRQRNKNLNLREESPAEPDQAVAASSNSNNNRPTIWIWSERKRTAAARRRRLMLDEVEWRKSEVRVRVKIWEL